MEINFDVLRNIAKKIEDNEIAMGGSFLKDYNLFFGMVDNLHSESKESVNTKINIREFLLQYNSASLPNVTCGILTYNEERCIERCISSIENEVDEILIIDSGSTDQTIPIIKNKFPKCKVLEIPWENNFAKQRNNILKHSSNPWILFLDADEYLDHSAKNGLKRIIKISTLTSYNDFCISPIIRDSNGHEYKDTKRIMNRDSNIGFLGKVHEEPLIGGEYEPNSVMVKLLIHHDGYQKEVIINKKKHHRNLELIKEMLLKQPHNNKWKFFYAKTLMKIDEPESQNKGRLILENIILSCDDNKSDKYLGMSLTLLCEYFLEKKDIANLNHYLSILKETLPACSDIGYFDISLSLMVFEYQAMKRINSYTDSFLDNDQSFSYLNSNNDHLKYMISIMSLYIGDYDKVNECRNKINDELINKKVLDLLSITHNQSGIILNDFLSKTVKV